MTYTRVASGDPGNSGATSAVTVVNALSAGLERLEAPFYDVTRFGAVGDGSTDDTDAIDDAITAINASTYGGVLFFPPGDFKTDGGHTLANQTRVMGCGVAPRLNSAAGITRIKTASATATVFTSTAPGCSFTDFSLLNTRFVESTLAVSGSAPTAGGGIYAGSGTQSSGDGVLFDRLYVAGFYDNVRIDNATEWGMNNCQLWAGVHYNLGIANTSLPDFGDAAINGSWFIPARSYANTTANVKWESGGGLKITNCKFNGGASSAPYSFTGSHLDLAVGTSTQTTDLLVSNNSFENYENYAVSVVVSGSGLFNYITLTGNQVAPYASGANGFRINGTSSNHVVGVSAMSNVMHGEAGTGTALSMDYVDYVKTANVYHNWATTQSITNYTNLTTL